MYRESKNREQQLSRGPRISLEQLHEHLREGDIKELNIILKTDVGGTAEVLAEMLQKLSNDKVKINVISKGVGAITESDVLLASTSGGHHHRLQRASRAPGDRRGGARKTSISACTPSFTS